MAAGAKVLGGRRRCKGLRAMVPAMTRLVTLSRGTQISLRKEKNFA
jgi:hypothetical protein